MATVKVDSGSVGEYSMKDFVNFYKKNYSFTTSMDVIKMSLKPHFEIVYNSFVNYMRKKQCAA